MSKPKSQLRKAAIFPEESEPAQVTNYVHVGDPIEDVPSDLTVTNADVYRITIETSTVIPPVIEEMIVRSVAATIKRGFSEKYCPYRSDSPEAARWLQLYHETKAKSDEN